MIWFPESALMQQKQETGTILRNIWKIIILRWNSDIFLSSYDPLTVCFHKRYGICQKTAAEKPGIPNTCAGSRISSWIHLSYLFDVPVMPICIQSHRHLSEKPIVALLTKASLYLKCANLASIQCRFHIKMSFLYLIVFVSDSEYYYHPPVTLIKNK